jgi:hypothetical protein
MIEFSFRLGGLSLHGHRNGCANTTLRSHECGARDAPSARGFAGQRTGRARCAPAAAIKNGRTNPIEKGVDPESDPSDWRMLVRFRTGFRREFRFDVRSRRPSF